MQFELFETHSYQELLAEKNFDQEMVEVYDLLSKGHTKNEIAKILYKPPYVVSKLITQIKAIWKYKEGDRDRKFQQMMWLNSGINLSQKIFEQNLKECFAASSCEFIFSFTHAQKSAIKLYLNGYSKAEIAKIFGDVGEGSIAKHLEVVKGNCEENNSSKNFAWLLGCEFSFQSLVHLVLLCNYASGKLDTDYKRLGIDQNLTQLTITNPLDFRPIITNQNLKSKLKHLRTKNPMIGILIKSKHICNIETFYN